MIGFESIPLLMKLISFLPDADPDILNQIVYSGESFRSLFAYINWIMPVDTLFTLLTTIIFFELLFGNSYLLFRIIKFISFGLIDLT